MEPALQILEEHGFLVPQAPVTQDGKLGRPAGPAYHVNPHIYTRNSYAQNPQNPQKGDAGGGFEDFEDFEIQETALNGAHSGDTYPCEHEHAGLDEGVVVCLDCGQCLGEESAEVDI